MRLIILFLILIILIGFFLYNRNLITFSEDLLQSDQNPELINYLQGDWAFSNNPKHIFKIKRDSIFEIYNDSIQTRNNLTYIFNEPASKYFKKDSSFIFHSSNNSNLNTQSFKLRKENSTLNDTTIFTLVYVSLSRMEMVSDSNIIKLNRVK